MRGSKEGRMNEQWDWDGMLLVRLMETSCFSFCLLVLYELLLVVFGRE